MYPGQQPNNTYPPPNNNYPPQQPPPVGFNPTPYPGYPNTSAPYPTSYPGQQQQVPYPGSNPYPNQQAYSPYSGQYPSAPPPTGQYPAQPSTGYPPAPSYPPTPGYPQTASAYPGQQQAPVAYPASQYPPQVSGAGYPGQQQQAPLYPQVPSQTAGYPPQQQDQFGIQKAHITTTHSQQPTTAKMQTYQDIPTIKEAYFVANDDAKALRTAMKGFGTDEAGIINVVTKRTNPQRLQIIQAYKASYGKDLIKDIKGEISGKFEQAIVALMTPRYEYLAKTVHDAISGIGTKERVLIDVLCTATNQEIIWIQQAYNKLYGKPMEQDIASDTSGYFERLLISTCAGGRNESPVIDSNMVAQDALDLVNAGIKKMGTDEAEFNRLLVTRSYPHLRAVFQEYEKVAGQDIERSIKSEFSGDVEDGLLAIVKCTKNRAQYFAERLHAAMKGMGTKDDLLIFLLVTRAEIDLENIKQEYVKLYGKNLVAEVGSETSGDYKKTLVALCG